ncbi:MAG: peptidase inhibitor family I36 protein [Pseudonocardiaceae bacterium]
MNHTIDRVGSATAVLAAVAGLTMVGAGTAGAASLVGTPLATAASPAPSNCAVKNLCLYDHQNYDGPDGGILRYDTPGAKNLQDKQYKHESDWRDKARSVYNHTSGTVTLYDTQGSAHVLIATLQPGEGRSSIPQTVDFVEI